MNRSIVEIVREYRRQYEQDASKADPTQLEEGRVILYDELEQSSWTPQIVHRGHELLHRLGDKQGIVDLLNRYLLRSLPIPEENWARWNLTDNLAMLRQCEEAVKSHKGHLTWARQLLPQPDWWLPPEWPFDFGHDWRPSRKDTPADEGLLFRIMCDGTQARCWIEVGESDQWLQIFYELMDAIPHTPRNRVERRYYLRTAGTVLNYSERPIKALQEAKRIDELAREDPNWEEALETEIDARYTEIEAYRILDDIPNLRRVTQLVTSRLDEEFQRRTRLREEEVKALWGMYHNLAAPIYRAKQYDLAIPLFQRAIALGIRSEYTYLWLAASIWSTKKDRSEVLSLLKRGVFYSRFGEYRKLPVEFKDVKDDAEFLAVMKRP